MGNHSLCAEIRAGKLQLHINKLNSCKSFCSGLLGAEWVFVLVPYGEHKQGQCPLLWVWNGCRSCVATGASALGAGWSQECLEAVPKDACLQPQVCTEDLEQPIWNPKFSLGHYQDCLWLLLCRLLCPMATQCAETQTAAKESLGHFGPP